MEITQKHVVAVALGVLSVALLAFPELAAAAELKDSMSRLSSQTQSVADVLSGFSYLAGTGVGVRSALLFKDHNENPANTKLSKPLTHALVAGMLLALPSFLTVGADSTGLTQKNSLSGGVLGGKLS